MTPTYQLTAEQTPYGQAFLRLKANECAPGAPVVLVLHGLGRSKEHMLPTLYAFAQQGYQAIGIDARLHGERENAGQRESLMQAEYFAAVQEMIVGTVQDLPHLLDTLEVTTAAIHGVSLGGYITFAALIHEPRLTVATVAMGSPDWLEGMRGLGLGPGHPHYDAMTLHNPLDLAADAYPPRPLLMLHGDQDEVVSINGVQALYEKLKPGYSGQPDRLALTVYPGLGHRYTDEMLQQSLAWTCHFLPPV